MSSDSAVVVVEDPVPASVVSVVEEEVGSVVSLVVEVSGRKVVGGSGPGPVLTVVEDGSVVDGGVVEGVTVVDVVVVVGTVDVEVEVEVVARAVDCGGVQADVEEVVGS